MLLLSTVGVVAAVDRPGPVQVVLPSNSQQLQQETDERTLLAIFPFSQAGTQQESRDDRSLLNTFPFNQEENHNAPGHHGGHHGHGEDHADQVHHGEHGDTTDSRSFTNLPII